MALHSPCKGNLGHGTNTLNSLGYFLCQGQSKWEKRSQGMRKGQSSK